MLEFLIAFVIAGLAVLSFWLGYREGKGAAYRAAISTPKATEPQKFGLFADDAAAIAASAIDLDQESLEWQIRGLAVRAHQQGMAELRDAFIATSSLPDGIAEQLATDAICALVRGDRAS